MQFDRLKGRDSSISRLFSSAIGHHRIGQLNEAEGLYRRVFAIDANHVGSLHHLGIAALHRGRIHEAVDLIGRAIAINDRDAQSHYHLGLALAALGRFEQTAHENRRAIALKPHYPEAHMNLGNALKAMGRTDEAAACYERAIALRSNFPEAHYNLANIRADRGEFDRAIAAYRRALKLRPQYAEAHHNFGTALMAQGKTSEATGHFRAALAINPNLVEAICSLAFAYWVHGDSVEALRLLCRELVRTPTEGMRELFVHCLRPFRELPPVTGLRALLVRAMTEPWARPTDLAYVGAYQVKKDNAFQRLAREASTALSSLSGDGALESSVLGQLARDPLFRAVLENCPVCDRDLERDLTNVRRRLLELVVSGDCDEFEEGALDFACILARQCFINEYVFACTSEEARHARELSAGLDRALTSGTPFPGLGVAIIGAYQSLQRLPSPERLFLQSWSKPLTTLVCQQVREPAQEVALQVNNSATDRYFGCRVATGQEPIRGESLPPLGQAPRPE
jgi:tetratricopeptide (TPR) repeat protein